MRQVRGRIWLGRLKITFTRVGTYFGYVNFLLLIVTFYSVTGYKHAPLWLFVCFALLSMITIGIVDYFFVLPSEVAFGNQQCALHQNPIYEDVKEIKKRVNEETNEE